MKKRLIFLPLLLLLCACGNARETNLLSPVSALAFDANEANLVLTVETAWQDSTEGSATPQYLTGKARTIPQCFTAIASGVGSDLYFSHAQVLILDTQVAQHNMLDLCKFLCSDSEIRLGIRFAVAHNTSAAQILQAWAPNGDIPGFALERILAQGKVRHNAIDMPFFRFYNQLLSGADANLPAITLGPDGQAIPDGTARFAGGKFIGFTEGDPTNAVST